MFIESYLLKLRHCVTGLIRAVTATAVRIIRLKVTSRAHYSLAKRNQDLPKFSGLRHVSWPQNMSETSDSCGIAPSRRASDTHRSEESVKHSLLAYPRQPAFLIGLFFACLFVTGALQARICHVAPNVVLAYGDSWNNPMPFSAALSDDTCEEIWLKQGVYKGSYDWYRGDIYGGFVGTETVREDRNPDPETNATVISGESSLVPGEFVNHVLEVTAAIHVMTIDGVTIRDGKADTTYTSEEEDKSGGGLLCLGSCKLNINNVRFVNNYAEFYGGAVAIMEPSNVTISNTEFLNNEADKDGGAVYIQKHTFYSSTAQLINVTATENIAYRGGVIASRLKENTENNLQMFISNSTFHNNIAAESGGAVANLADQYSEHGSQLAMILSSVTFTGNTAGHGGAAIYNKNYHQQSGNIPSPVEIVIENSILWDNTSESGAPGSANWVIRNDGSGTSTDISWSILQHGCDGNTCSNLSLLDPMLGPLGRHRSPTRVRVPDVGSPAVDNGAPVCGLEDQRGVSRPQDGDHNGSTLCDMGAVEVAGDAGVCRVSANPPPAGNGSTWSSTMDIQIALNDPTCEQLWLAMGLYKPSSGTDRSISFRIRSGVEVLGHFVGTETDPGQRKLNHGMYETVLSGDIGGAADTDNSYHVVVFDGASNPINLDTVLADVTVEKGFSSTDMYDYPNNVGAGVFCNGSGGHCSPTLINVKIQDNAAIIGGGMCNTAVGVISEPQLWDVEFHNNYAIKGGAMANLATQFGRLSPKLINFDFINNEAIEYGGGIYNQADQATISPHLISGTFSDNSAIQLGGAVYNKASTSGRVDPRFNNTRFHSNDGGQAGGAVYSLGEVGSTVRPEFHNVDFYLNTASSGGALFNADVGLVGAVIAQSATFRSNHAVNGGAIYNYGSGSNYATNPAMMNVTFHGNTASGNGGAVYNNGNNYGHASPSFTNATFSNNNAQYGGAIYSDGNNGYSHTTLNNVILWQNTASQDAGTSQMGGNDANGTINDSIVEGGCPVSAQGTNACSNVITADPQLGTLADNGGFTLTMLPGAASSAIDAGNDSTCAIVDQRGTARPLGAHCDIGAVESAVQAPSDLIFKNGFD